MAPGIARGSTCGLDRCANGSRCRHSLVQEHALNGLAHPCSIVRVSPSQNIWSAPEFWDPALAVCGFSCRLLPVLSQRGMLCGSSQSRRLRRYGATRDGVLALDRRWLPTSGAAIGHVRVLASTVSSPSIVCRVPPLRATQREELLIVTRPCCQVGVETLRQLPRLTAHVVYLADEFRIFLEYQIGHG